MPSWAESAIWWHAYPLGFVGAPIRGRDHTPGHRLPRLLNWLDHLLELGCNGLLLGPVFTSAEHGYDTTNFFEVDPRLGDEADLDALVEACHRKGIRILLDGVFSHVSDTHPDAVRALAEGRDGELASLFDIDWDAEGGPLFRTFEGHGPLVRLNHASAAASELVHRVMTHWLARGIDGWRLDAAYSIPDEFWARVLPAVREQFPQAWFLGEVIHGDYPAIVAASGMDTVTQYELWKALWSSLADQNLWELDHALGRHNDFLETFVPQTFVGNHDVTRIASRVGTAGAVAALAVLMTVGGIPSIYAGDEEGFRGVKTDQAGGDDEVRPEFPEHPDGLNAIGAPVARAHQQLIGLRRRHPWLTTARTERLAVENTALTYRTSAIDGSASLEVTLDCQGAPWAEVRDPQGTVLWRTPGDLPA